MPTKAGPYSKNNVTLTRGDSGDKPFGSPRQLDIEKNYAQGRARAFSWPPGGNDSPVGPLPKDGK